MCIYTTKMRKNKMKNYNKILQGGGGYAKKIVYMITQIGNIIIYNYYAYPSITPLATIVYIYLLRIKNTNLYTKIYCYKYYMSK